MENLLRTLHQSLKSDVEDETFLNIFQLLMSLGSGELHSECNRKSNNQLEMIQEMLQKMELGLLI